jgi:hypothetical protein
VCERFVKYYSECDEGTVESGHRMPKKIHAVPKVGRVMVAHVTMANAYASSIY